MDAIRAKRAFEESERTAREKEKQEIIIRVLHNFNSLISLYRIIK